MSPSSTADPSGHERAAARGPRRTPGRLPDRLLALAVVLLILSGGYWLHARLTAEQAAPRNPGAAISVVPLIDPDPCPVETRHERPAYVGYRLPDGDALVGFESAWIFPGRDGAPTFAGGVEVTACQVPGGLDLRPWVADRTPGGPHWLFFALRVARASETCSWRGWCRFEASDLGHLSLSVAPRRGDRVEIRVRTAEGQAVPGALVSIDPAPLGPGRVQHLAHTDAEGRIVVCGLEPDATMTARLVEGVGPRAVPVETMFEADADVVELEVALGGRWTFAAHEVRLPLAGASSRLAQARAPGGALPRAWPVSRWVGPGRGPDTPVYFMFRDADPRDAKLPLRMQFDGYPPVDFEDARTPTHLELRAAPRRVVTRPVK